MTTTFTTSSLSPSKSSPLIASPPSLAHAQYGDDRVNLHIFIDHFKDIDSTDNGSVKLDAKLNESRRILDFVDGFSWKFGEKIMHYWTGNVGLQEQWLEVWWPSSDDEFAFVVEDDLEISLLCYKFLRDLIVNYYYNSSNFNPSIYGASLQRRRFVPGAFLEALATADFNISVSGQYRCGTLQLKFSLLVFILSLSNRSISSKRGNKLQLDSGTSLFLYQLVALGASFCFQDLGKSSVCGMTHTRPRASSHSFRGCISHRDAGVNYGKTAGPDSYLLDEDFNLLEMHPLSKLKWCRSSSLELERRQFENGIAMCLELGILAQKTRIGKKIALELPNMTIDELKHH
ncbi:hypothetical protein TEA_000007 [Camellia sinensis var. sinensis]|uniref:Uncharacterized protein n=1 Tax=Camellia sinensis var. sinensis TaxID=542762 RepID=A0A4V3WN37_CAMSN|nr:hypothetical protein TEA_000007 [Camellia sinensis var. sinensis]